MKTNLKKASLLLTGLMVGSKLFAQTPDSTMNEDYVKPFSDASLRTWSIGINGGLLTPFNVFGPNSAQDFTLPGNQIGYGGYIKKQFLPGFAVQLDFLRGKVKGEGGAQTGSVFETNLNYAASISGNFTLANINWRNKKGAIQPYITAGWGLMGYKPTLNGQPIKANDESTKEYFVPVGLGLKFNLSRGVNLDLGYQVNFVGNDNFDGYKYRGNSDKFSYAHIGLEFALGSSKKTTVS